MRQVVVMVLVVAASSLAEAQRAGEHAEAAAPPEQPAIDAGEGGVRPNRYIVGPGDRLRVTLWGLQELQQEIEVTADGRLFVPRAGVFEAAGRTLSQLRSDVEGKLHALYPGLSSSLTLTRPRTFLVHVTGAVQRPGTYAASPLVRVSAMLPRAGGALPYGSLRRVEIRRRGVEKPIYADLTRFNLFGEIDQDPQLLDGDTLYVPPRQVAVEVSGGVRRPGTYELTAARTLAELLELAGGFTPQASRVRPLRITSRTNGDSAQLRSVSAGAATATVLHDGDVVYVPISVQQRPTVMVQGAVKGTVDTAALAAAPAPEMADDARLNGNLREVTLTLPFVDGEGVRDAVAEAGGLQPWADSRRAYISRRDDKGAAHHLPVDLAQLATGADDDIPLRAGDTLVVPVRREQVFVAGAVQRPGYYAYSGDLKAVDYVSLAGGATRAGDVGDARILSNGHSRPIAHVETVEPGDVITVPERRFTAADWTNMALIIGNIGIGAATLAVTAAHH